MLKDKMQSCNKITERQNLRATLKRGNKDTLNFVELYSVK